jgi:large subunit ribosomal protein L28
MSRVCDICGKGAVKGSTILRRGQAKKKGGIGQHVTAITKRQFAPNLQSVRASVNGQTKRVRICTACLRTGHIKKAA